MARDSRHRRLTRIGARTCTGDGEPPTKRTSIQDHLVGHYSVNPSWECSTVTEFVPFPAGPAVDLRQRFSLHDFVIDGEHRLSSSMITDSRGGLLAFVHDNRYAIVCDPWTGDCMQLEFPWRRRPVGNPGDPECRYDCLGVFFLNDDDGDEKSSLMSGFSVLCVCLQRFEEVAPTRRGRSRAHACVFSAGDNAWIRWTASSEFYKVVSTIDKHQRFLGRARGSMFFSTGIVNGLLVLDEATGNFSTIILPLEPYVYSLYVDRESLRVVNGGAGTLVRIVCLVDEDLKVLKVTRAEHGGWECMLETSVGLCQLANIGFSAHRSWRFLDTTTTVAAATLVLGAEARSSTLLFSLDVETMNMKLQLANKNTTNLNAKRVFPYELPWPQTINQCRPVNC